MINIYCDGGLGNRLLMMFSGIFYAQMALKPFIIHWPRNNWCGCSFADLFDNPYNVTNFNLKFLDENILENCTLFVHETQIQHRNDRGNKLFLHSRVQNMTPQGIIGIFASSPNLLYYGNSLHQCLTPETVTCIVEKLKINEDVMSKIARYNVSNCYGAHIRGTDFPEAPLVTIEQLEAQIKEFPKHEFFVCSDQKDIEDNLKTRYPNVVVFEKSKYVERLDKKQDWHGRITDDLDRSFNFNVNRPKTSVIEAFCDMLLLSRTKMIKTSNSSFLKCAYVLSKGKL